MDVNVKKKHPLLRYKYIILLVVAVVALTVIMLVRTGGPSRLRYDKDKLTISEVRRGGFTEYMNAEGIADASYTLRLNTSQSGTVSRLVAQAGDYLNKGDTILILENPELERAIEDDRYNMDRQAITYREKLLQMERKTSELRRATLKAVYELERLSKQYVLDKEEYEMGIKSKAQFDVAADDYRYNTETTRMLLEELRNDSLANTLQLELMEQELRQEREKFRRSLDRMAGLVLCAPVSGQLNNISLVPGEKVNQGVGIGEIKAIEEYKITIQVNEYYLDRIYSGLPATVAYQGRQFPMRVSRINKEVKERFFPVDLVFDGEMPDNIVLGKTYQVRIELGQVEEAVIINKGNFMQATGGRWIFKLNESGTKAVRTDIAVGRQNPSHFEVLRGLEPGDIVIVTGYDFLGNAQELILK